MKKRGILLAILWLVLGCALGILSFFETLDEFWSGMGAALVAVGATRLLRGYRLSRSDIYREKRNVAETDERFQFIRSKAWAWAGSLFIVISALCTILFQMLGQKQWCLFTGGAVCIMLVLYWVSFFILKKKY